MKRNSLYALLISLFIVFLFSPVIGQNNKNTKSNKKVFTNPVLDRGADPWAYWYKGNYYYVQSVRNKLVLWVTPDITDLRNAKKVTVWTPTDQESSKHVWAPEIHRIDGKWYIYYAADDGNTDNHQMYVVENASEDPTEGEFVFKGRISTDTDDNWAIDGSVFRHNDELYFVWSGWQTRRIDTETQCIYIAKMKNPWTLSTERVLISKPDQEWERHNRNPNGKHPKHLIYVNEGPQPLASPNYEYMHIVYSASGVWTPYYCLGMLSAKTDSDLLNPDSWVKSDGPVFQQSPENKVYGPGHNSFFKSPDGKEDYLFYHARDTKTDVDGQGDCRSPRIQKFEWKNEFPIFGTPVAAGVELKKPSGTKTRINGK